MKEINFKESSVIVFIIISISYLVANIIWWKINTPIILYDASALHFYDIFKTGYLYYNAPLITWIMKGMFFIFGREYFDLQIILVNYVFFLIALYFIYKIGIELKDRQTGNIAMILFALTPAVYGMSRQYGHQDWHVMVAMVVNIYCLIKSDNFKDRKWSIIYGISVGFGLLIKDEFLAYFFAPWLYVVIRSLIERADLKRVINILTTIITGSLIAGCHYFRTKIIEKILNEPVIETLPIFDFENLRVTTVDLSEYLLSPPIFILFLIGLVWFVYKYKNKNKYIILLYFIVPWTILTFMPQRKLVEYCLGFVPAIVLFIAVWISNLRKVIIKKVFLIVFILICFLQFLDFSYGKGIFHFDFMIFKNIRYFTNINNSLVGEESNIEINLLKYLNKFSESIIYIERRDWNPFLLTALDLLNGNNKEIRDFIFLGLFRYDIENEFNNNTDIDIVDYNDVVIVVIGKEYSDLELAERVHFYSIDMHNFSENVEHKNKKIQEFLKKIEKGKKYIKENFYLLEEFYLGDIKKEEYLVKVYKKNKV